MSDIHRDTLERHVSAEVHKSLSDDTATKESLDVSNDVQDASSEVEEKSIGVLKAEIIAAQWAGKWYYQAILLFSAFLVGYGYGLDGQIRYVFTGYATASYAEHSLLTTIGVVTAVAAAACQPVYARLSDVFGRFELFIVSIVFYVVGTIIESQSKSVQIYAAGSVFYQIGYTGVILIIMCILADFSSLKWRLFYLFVPTFPFIINTWISGDVTSALGMDWSWAIGMWAFIFPLLCLPMIGCMLHMRWLAGRTEEWRQFRIRQTKFQELGPVGFAVYLFWKLDIIGLLLLIVCLGCLLVPLTIAGGVKSKWQDGSIIAPIVIGGLLLPVFGFWESYGARHPIAPFHLLKDRGVWAALVISFLLNFISAIESSYLYAVLLVAVDETQKSATRITSLSSFVSVIGGVFFGLFVVKWRRLKGFIIFGCAIWMVSLGILLHFRSGTSATAGIIGGVCLMGFGTTFFSYPVNVSMQTCTTHEHMAVIISLGLTVYRIGYAAGSSVAGAVWTQALYDKLLDKLGNAELALAAYTDPYTFIIKYTWDTPERQDVVAAYRELQRLLIIIPLVFCVPMLFAGLFLRDHKLNDNQSNKDIEKADNNESLGGYIKNSLNFKKNSEKQ